MPAPWIRAHPLAIALTAVAAAACQGDGLMTPTAADAVSADVGLTVRDEVEATVNALTLPSTLTPLATVKETGDPAIPCVAPSTPADADGDGIPDDATYVFTAPPCRFTGWRGGTVDIVGSLQVQDPAPAGAGFGYDATLTTLRFRFTGPDPDVIFDVERSGTQALSGSVNGLLLTSDLQLRRTFSGKPDANVDQQWTVNYTPAAQLQINGPLNTGSLSFAGTFNWVRGDENLALTVTTPTPLHYNAACGDTVQRIDAGEMHLAGKFADNTDGFVRVRWTECGKDPSFGFGFSE
jgi:hypothetical protein